MIRNIFILLILSFMVSAVHGSSQRIDKAIFVEDRNEYKEMLLEKKGEEVDKDVEKVLKMDFEGVYIPHSIDDFKQAWHFAPKPQDLTGSCWSFSSISFFETEVYRITGKKIKLSEMFVVYWEFVEKARRFVKEKGDSVFSRGSQPNSARLILSVYGVVPQEMYGMKKSEEDIYDDRAMYREMKEYIQSVKEEKLWNEEEVISHIKSILNSHMGEPPDNVVVDGKSYTPVEYVKNILKINPNDYVDVMSLEESPFYKEAEYKVADNWGHCSTYYNVPLEDFMNIIKKSVMEGYTVCIAGDNSEPGFYPQLDVAMIPSFDIIGEYIDDNARQFRFSNESTTDDHAIHLVGAMEKDGEDWYLIKDSSVKAQNGRVKGYVFYHEDFIKLKMMNMLVHKNMISNINEK